MMVLYFNQLTLMIYIDPKVQLLLSKQDMIKKNTSKVTK